MPDPTMPLTAMAVTLSKPTARTNCGRVDGVTDREPVTILYQDTTPPFTASPLYIILIRSLCLLYAPYSILRVVMSKIPCIVPAALFAAFTVLQASPLCSLTGVTRNSAGAPVADVQITVHSVAGSTDRTVVSAGDGVFCVADLQPGKYEVTAKLEGIES